MFFFNIVYCICFLFFFFQAEDGIRDATVTGVQTCALPISWVHPYDDAQVMAGQGTIALEMLEESPELELLVFPIGGGGLIAGNAVAAKAVKPSIGIIGVEAALYPSMWNAVRGDHRPIGGPTLAEGIAVKNVGKLALPLVAA